MRRIGTGNTRLWAEDLRFTFKRAATNYTPTIIATFEEQQVPILLGVYIPMIESEYRNNSRRVVCRGAFESEE